MSFNRSFLRLKSFNQYSVFKVQIHLTSFHEMNGDGEIRTLDPLLARQVLSQLSYAPVVLILNCILSDNGLEWTRTTDLTLIRRAL